MTKGYLYRTTNGVDSPAAAKWVGTVGAKRYKVAHAEALIWKILTIADKKFRRLNRPKLVEEVYQGKNFVDGFAVNKINRRLAA